MPEIPNLKPIIKVTEKQIKQLVRRLMSDSGAIKPTATRAPVLGQEIVAARTEVVPRPNTFQRFPEGPRTEVRPELPFRQSGMTPNPYAQMVIPEVLPPRRITQQRVGEGLTMPPNRSDLIYNRIVAQRTGPSAFEKLGQYVEPPEVPMGRLYRDNDGIIEILDLPLEEARAKLKADSTYMPVNRPMIPPVTRLRKAPADLSSDASFVQGLVYERLKWKPVETLDDRVVQATVAAASKEVGVKITKEETRTIADTFNDMWRGFAGRGRGSEEAQLWNMYRQGAVNQKRVSNVEGASAKTYFVRSAQMYKNNPTEFARKFPREAKRLSENWDRYMNGAKSKGTKHVHHEGRQSSAIGDMNNE